MTALSFTIHLPLDLDMFLRRECPYCFRQFKTETTEDDRRSLVEREMERYLLQQGLAVNTHDDEPVAVIGETEVFCPYCGQTAPRTHWWTQEQLAYVHTFAYNIMAEIINERFIHPMKQQFSGRSRGMITMRFEGKELEYREPWISPELDDMEPFSLPCCQLRIKTEDGWYRTVFCIQCGFPHEPSSTNAVN